MNLTELIDIYSWKFGSDLPRYIPRQEIIDAVVDETPIDAIGIDVVRAKITSIIWYYYDLLAPQMECDLCCVNCPAGQVLSCYTQFAESYPTEARIAVEKFSDSEP